MKKKLLTTVLSLTLIFALLLTGCVNQGMADKINEKAKSSEGYTYAQLLADYDKPTIDATNSLAELNLPKFGMVVYIKDCKDLNEANAQYEKGKTLNAVYVYIDNGKVTKAEFKRYKPEEHSH